MNSTPSSPSLASGVRWSTVAAVVGMTIELVRTGLIAVLLPLSEIGLAAFALLLVQFSFFMKDAGIGQALVRHHTLDRLTYSSVFWFNLSYGAALSVVIFLLASPSAHVFAMPRLEPLVQIAAFMFLFASLGQVQSSVLTREMRFRSLAIAEISGSVVGALTMLGVALYLPTAAAMVYGRLFETLTVTAIAIYFVHGRHHLSLIFSWKKIVPLLNFGIFVSFDKIFTHMANHADRFFIGIFAGTEILGVYHIAANLTIRKARSIGMLIMRVVYPAMAKIYREGATPPHLMTLAHRFLLVFMITPLLAAVVVFMLIGDLLPPEWATAVPLTQILVLAAIFSLLRAPVRSLMFTHNMARDVFVIGLMVNIVVVGGSYVAARYADVYAVASVLVVAEAMRFGIMMFWLNRTGRYAVTLPVVRAWLIAGGVLALAVTSQALLMFGKTNDAVVMAAALAMMTSAAVLALVGNWRVVGDVAHSLRDTLRRRPDAVSVK